MDSVFQPKLNMFIKENFGENDKLYNFELFSETNKKTLNDIYLALYRFNLRKPQIKFILQKLSYYFEILEKENVKLNYGKNNIEEYEKKIENLESELSVVLSKICNENKSKKITTKDVANFLGTTEENVYRIKYSIRKLYE